MTDAIDEEMPAMHETRVLDATMFHREEGEGRSVVFLHGNPMSSYLFRDVLPHVSAHARCLAPDLVGMGRSSKPDIAYRLADHARYLDAWFDANALEDVVLVGHDWGGALAMDHAARHPGRVRGLVAFETFFRPMSWREWPTQGAELFRALRTPGVGEKMVLEENLFLDRSLAHGVERGLADDARAQYYAPYPDAASRRPLLQWPREIPIDGEPADVVDVFARFGAWLARSVTTPKLVLTFGTPSVLGSEEVIAWVRAHAASVEISDLGRAGHHAPEDRPDEIGRAIAAWLGSHGLVAGA